jgi:hypothetical protein
MAITPRTSWRGWLVLPLIISGTLACGSRPGDAADAETGSTESESETGESWAGVPCIERLTYEACVAGPVDPDNEYGDVCVWTELQAVSQDQGACSFGPGEFFCLSQPMVLDGCAGTQPSGCMGAESSSIAAAEFDGVTYVLDVTDDCDAPRELETCWVDDPDAPAICDCSCAFATGQ